MSYEKCKSITIDKNGNLKLVVACNNVRPLSYRTTSFVNKNILNTEEQLMFLFEDLILGNIHIAALNESTIKYQYALEKAKEYSKVQVGCDIIARISKANKYAASELAEKYGVNDDTSKLRAKYLKLVLGEIFEIFKNALNEKHNEKYVITNGDFYITKMGKYDEGYSRYYYYESKQLAKRFDYKHAYIILKDFESKNLKLEMV